VVSALAIVDRRVDRRSREETVAQLGREAALAAIQLAPGRDADSMSRAIAASTGRRVTILDSAGGVIGDSEIPLSRATLENQRSRPDVLAALDSGRLASAEYNYAGSSLVHVSAPAPAIRGAVRMSVSPERTRALYSGLRRDLLTAGLVALVFSLGFAALFARSITGPVVELRDVARSLADGNLTRRPSISASGEIGELARAVHRLSEQLSARLGALATEELLLSALLDSLQEGVVAIDTRRQVVRINAAGRALLDISNEPPFSTDLLPRHRVLREALAEALAGRTSSGGELELDTRQITLTARPLAAGGAVLALFDITPIRRLEAVRRDFVANVSHELRTPLTIIGGFAETLSESDVPSRKRQEFAALIRSNSQRMQRLVDDLLDLSRIESGGWTPKPAAIDVEEAVREVVSQLEVGAGKKGLRIASAIAPDARVVFADPIALRQILVNLMENAIRYTSEGGITVSSECTAEGIRISVADTGTGIPAEHLARIFERFYRVDPGRSREQGGTGLGLAIVRHMAEAHRGTAAATSAPGTGTTVTVLFPFA
jgi:signal transduction histidine kinase